MRRILGLLLVSTAGCSGFAPPTSDQLRTMGLSGVPTPEIGAPYVRQRIRMSVDSPWLAGEFEGVVVVRRGVPPVSVRVQLFGDLGPKALDVIARPDRIVGYFPQTHEGIDCALPGEAGIHPLLFLGVSLIEEFSERSEDRVRGVREEKGGCWVLLKSAIEGLEVVEFKGEDGQWTRRRFHWTRGVTWEQERTGKEERRITASGLSIRVKILESDAEPPRNPAMLEPALPSDIRVVLGSRK